MKYSEIIHAGCLSAAFIAVGCGDEPEVDARKLQQVVECKVALDGEFGGPVEDCEVVALTEVIEASTGGTTSGTTGEDSDASQGTSGGGTTWDMGVGTTWDMGGGSSWTGTQGTGELTYTGSGEDGGEDSDAATNTSEPGNSSVADTELGTGSDSDASAGDAGSDGGSGDTDSGDSEGDSDSDASTSGGEGGATSGGGGDTTSGGGGDTGGGDTGGPPAVCPTHWAQAPRATSTAHIDGFNPLPEVAAMIAVAPWAARAANPATGPAFVGKLTGLITALAASANPAPPATFSPNAFGNGFAPWRNSKEYRGYIDMAQFRIRCDSKTGKLVARQGTPGNKVGDFIENQKLWSSYGYTRLPGPVFLGGEPPAVKPWTNVVAFGDAAGGNKGSCVTNFGYVAARIGAVQRAAAFPVLGFDAPFIWEDLSSTVCCDGNYEVRFTGSHFPTMSLYINYDRIKFIIQTALPTFIASGAPAIGAVGVGTLAGAGPANKVAGKARVIDDCNGQVTQEYTPKPSKPM